MAITLAVKDAPTRRRRLAKLLERQAAISASEGMGQEPIDPALESELASWR